MSLENFWKDFESNEDLPKLKKASPEDIEKVWKDIEYSNQLQKANDVLNVLWFPDNKEKSVREILLKQDKETLEKLSKKSKKEILDFVVNYYSKDTNNVEFNEKQSQLKENQEFNNKIEKLNSIFSPTVLNNHPDISSKINELNKLDTLTQTEQKEEVIRDIFELLKEPWKLQSIIKDLWWVDTKEYKEFKENLIWLDSSFENVFNDFETQNFLNTNDVIKDIEKDSNWMLNINLDSKNPVSKFSLLDSDYSFDKTIDKEALWELSNKYKENILDVKNGEGVLKEEYSSFSSFINQIWSFWWKEGFKDNLQILVSNFSNELFWDLSNVYKSLNIDSSIQLNKSDILDLVNISNPNDLKSKIENIKDKFLKVRTHILEEKSNLEKEYKSDLKELVDRKNEVKEKQTETLKFLKNSWFDLIPKDISNKLIAEIQSNTLTIPWLDLARQNIDLENWHFWESGAFIDKDWGINIEAKRNIVMFMNKFISWDLNEPLSIEAISSGTGVVDSNKLKGLFLKNGLVGNMGWNYGKIISNLEKNKQN